MLEGKIVTVAILGNLLPVKLKPDEFLFVRVIRVSGLKSPETLVEGPVEAFHPTAPVMKILQIEDENGKVVWSL